MDTSPWIGVPPMSSARMPPSLWKPHLSIALGGVSRFQGSGTHHERRKRTTKAPMKSRSRGDVLAQNRTPLVARQFVDGP
jgi:hypothetical protein